MNKFSINISTSGAINLSYYGNFFFVCVEKEAGLIYFNETAALQLHRVDRRFLQILKVSIVSVVDSC